MSESDWVVQREGNRYPASDVAMLQQWAASGGIGPNDQVWSPIRGEWTAAKETPEIAELMVGPGQAVAAANDVLAMRASVSLRAAAYLIDVIPAVLVALIAFIPLIGHIVAGVLLGIYWLYRDAMNWSLGKICLGLKVVQANGEPATKHALVRRNLPFGIPAFVGAIPILGMFIGPIVGFVAVATSALLLVSEGYTLGDKWAGTTVVKRT